MKNDWNYAYTKTLVYISEHSGGDPIAIMVWTQSKYCIWIVSVITDVVSYKTKLGNSSQCMFLTNIL